MTAPLTTLWQKLQRAGPAPHWAALVALVVGVGGGGDTGDPAQGLEHGRAGPPLIYMAWVWGGCPLPSATPTSCSSWESWQEEPESRSSGPASSLAVALRRAGSTPCSFPSTVAHVSVQSLNACEFCLFGLLNPHNSCRE